MDDEKIYIHHKRNTSCTIIPNWLIDAMCVGNGDVRPRDYVILGLILSWPTDTYPTPAAAMKHFKKIGSSVSRRTVFDAFARLRNAGHIRVIRHSGEGGKFGESEYHVYVEPFQWLKSE